MKIWVTVIILFMVTGFVSAKDLTDETGHLKLKSSPPGAQIEIDGVVLDTVRTPAILTLPAGPRFIRMRLGYLPPETLTVNIRPNRYTEALATFNVSVGVEPLSEECIVSHEQFCQLEILTDLPGASVWVDGVKVVMATPFTLTTLSAGLYQIGIGYDDLFIDTTITVVPDSVTSMYIELTDETLTSTAPSSDSVDINIIVQLPACQYRRDRSGFGVEIKGVDTQLSIRAGEKRTRLTHRELAQMNVKRDKFGVVTRRQQPDTTLIIPLRVAVSDSAHFRFLMHVNNARKFAETGKLSPIVKSFQIPAMFNDGAEINVRARVERNGELIFRYW